MPGPVSDSLDSEFGTSSNARDVRDAINEVIEFVNLELGPELKDIVEVAQNGPIALHKNITMSERELRCIRFGLLRALESI